MQRFEGAKPPLMPITERRIRPVDRAQLRHCGHRFRSVAEVSSGDRAEIADPAVALQLNRFCLNSCGAIILRVQRLKRMIMHSKKHWAPGDGVKVLRVVRSAAGGWNVCAATAEAGICPDCGNRSHRRHGWRHRRLQDYPAHGEAVFIELRIARWRCLSQGCSRSTFSDQAPTVAAPHARRTLRSAQIASCRFALNQVLTHFVW